MLFALAAAGALAAQVACSRARLPAALSDREFWRLATELSESPGAFSHSDNLVSNESFFADIMRTLRPRGGVYIGVGPEQNFSYIAEIRPLMAFIVDVRSENRSLHLLYKALFELATDRADFLSKLFSRERPADLGPTTSVQHLFDAFATAAPQRWLREETGRLVKERLTGGHQFPLDPRDLAWIDYALDAFYADGPEIHYARLLPHDPRGPSYRALMTATDVVTHQHRSYLAEEQEFQFVKDLHTRNLIVPVVGDFGGPTALWRTADYIREHGEVVSAFYGSNVEVYLNREKSAVFCLNLARMPHHANSYFIGSKGKQPLRLKLAACRGAMNPKGGEGGSQ